MKGFLNKVQQKATGKPDGKAEGAPAAAAPAGNSAQANVAAAAGAARAEATPRADISLPRRHDRRSVALLFTLFTVVLSMILFFSSDDLHLLATTKCKPSRNCHYCPKHHS